MVFEAAGTSWVSSELHTPISDGSAPACPSKDTPVLLGFRSLSPRFHSPMANPKAIFYRKGALAEELCSLPLPSLAGSKVLQLPKPKYAFAGTCRAMQIPSSQGHTPLTCSWEKSSLQTGPHQSNYCRSLRGTSDTNPIFKEALRC